jgi:hypothetical protein
MSGFFRAEGFRVFRVFRVFWFLTVSVQRKGKAKKEQNEGLRNDL